ncbi:MAG: dynamin family protein [Cyanobacteria bacterium J06650_10]
MNKFALVIGVSEYTDGLKKLDASTGDVAALSEVLSHPQIGGFKVKTLLNPTSETLSQSLEIWFLERKKEDTCIIFFSGHGLKDDQRNLYFGTTNTRKFNGHLVTSTAVAARTIYSWMNRCRARQQVIILDCCFSGAFGDVTAKDDGSIDFQEQLVEQCEGRIVLTSTNSVDYAFEQKGSEISIYTQYLVEGMRTGAADLDGDGKISVDELHCYAKRKVKEESPAMEPQIISIREGEGYRIIVAEIIKNSSKLIYRKEVDRIVRDNSGNFSFLDRAVLDELFRDLGLSIDEATEIENQALKPFENFQDKLRRYEHYFSQVVQSEYPVSKNSRKNLNRLLEVLKVREEDVASIESAVISQENRGFNYETISRRDENDRQLSPYDSLQQREKRILGLLDETNRILHPFGLDEEVIKRFVGNIQSDTFKVLVLGEFKRGKSTLINALLGEDILPSYAIPTTAVVSEIKWGIKKKALLHFNKTNDGQQPPPVEIPVSDLEEYVVLKRDELFEGKDSPSRNYAKVEIFWPLSFCRNGVELIDSPGLNEHRFRQEVTTSYTENDNVDAIIFVLSCEQLCSRSEMDIIDDLTSASYENIFFICNRFDLLREQERGDIRAYGLSKLAHKTKRNRVFFISALMALDGRINDDTELIDESGLINFEEELENFLVRDRGRIKTLRVLHDIEEFIVETKRKLSSLAYMKDNANELKSTKSALDKVDSELRQLVHEIEYQDF